VSGAFTASTPNKSLIARSSLIAGACRAPTLGYFPDLQV
jgi:hypothetical protein